MKTFGKVSGTWLSDMIKKQKILQKNKQKSRKINSNFCCLNFYQKITITSLFLTFFWTFTLIFWWNNVNQHFAFQDCKLNYDTQNVKYNHNLGQCVKSYVHFCIIIYFCWYLSNYYAFFFKCNIFKMILMIKFGVYFQHINIFLRNKMVIYLKCVDVINNDSYVHSNWFQNNLGLFYKKKLTFFSVLKCRTFSINNLRSIRNMPHMQYA